MSSESVCPCRCHLGGAFVACDVDSGSSGVPGVAYCGPHGTGMEPSGYATAPQPAGGSVGAHAPESTPQNRSKSRGGIGPCAYPGCRDRDGNPRLTHATFCDGCQHRYRRLLDWIVLDFALLRRDLPSPVALGNRDGADRPAPKSKIFGHPREWASITSAEIAESLNWAEDGLRDVQGHEPPPHPGVREAGRVAHAYRYLTAQFSALCSYEAAEDTAVELGDLHRKVRHMLGYTRVVQLLPTPCPWCDVAALVRDVDKVECRECGKVIEEKMYPWLTGWIVDQLIEQYDTQKSAELA